MYEVKWTNRASLKYYETLHYWDSHNKSDSYSKKIVNETAKTISLIKSNPKIGRIFQTKEGKVRRVLVFMKFSIYYRVIGETIEIVAFWSNSQKPL